MRYTLDPLFVDINYAFEGVEEMGLLKKGGFVQRPRNETFEFQLYITMNGKFLCV